MLGMALPIARDLMGEGIRVNTILPGVFETPMVAMMPQNVKDALAAQVPFPKRLGQRGGICAARRVHGRERLSQRRICPPGRRDPDGAALSSCEGDGAAEAAPSRISLGCRGVPPRGSRAGGMVMANEQDRSREDRDDHQRRKQARIAELVVRIRHRGTAAGSYGQGCGRLRQTQVCSPLRWPVRLQ